MSGQRKEDTARPELRDILDAVWANTFWVENALQLYEGISKHAKDLDEHAHFFGLIQKFALDAAVLGISRLFDRSNGRYRKNTIPDLFEYVKSELNGAYIARLTPELLTRLGIRAKDAAEITTALRDPGGFERMKEGLIAALQDTMPTVDRCFSLKTIITYRDKVVAHQEHISEAVREQLAELPSIDHMERINKWAANFCVLAASVLTPNLTLAPGGRSARMAALNVVAKALGINLDDLDYAAREAFYKRD